MRLAVLVKQIPAFEELELGPDGRLNRDGVDLEMNPYCRRAVSQACELAAAREGSSVVVITLGPPAAEDVLREAIAWGLARDVAIEGVLVTDPAFAGSDTLATAQALAEVLDILRPFDLVLSGRNSVDADTGQVGPEVAQLRDLPFLTGVRELNLVEATLEVRCEHDDGWLDASVMLPAVISCAERLIDPTKVDAEGRAAVPAELITRMTAADLGPGPWGQAASPTWVGPVKLMAVDRARQRWPELPLDEQIERAVHVLEARGALAADDDQSAAVSVPACSFGDRTIVVIAEPDRLHATRELLGAAAGLGGCVTVFSLQPPMADVLGTWGADNIVHLRGDNIEEDVARTISRWVADNQPWAVLTESTAWGREVASRIAALVGAGLVGDAVDIELSGDRLVAWKPAFGGQLVAAVGISSPIQMATVRAGMLPTLLPRPGDGVPSVETLDVIRRGRVHVKARTRDDDIEVLADARAVVALGLGVAPDDYPLLQPLCEALHAELGATRKVTDKGWMPRARQIGITGRTIAPRLVVSIGASGKFNHVVGLRAAGTVLAINPDPNALIFDAADVGIVGDWRDVVPRLIAQLPTS